MYSVILVSSAKHVTESFNSMHLWENQSFNLELVTSDLQEALQKTPDVLICPFNNPDFSGCELARKLFVDKSKTKVVLYGRKSYDSVKSAINARAWGYLSMPLELDDFFSLFINLRQYLDTESKDSLPHFDLTQLRCEFFQKLLSQTISEKAEVEKEFSMLRLPVSYTEDSCTIIHFTINNFSGYLTNKWKYGKDALYVAVNNFIAINRSDIISLPVNKSDNNVYIAVFGLSDDEICSKYAETTKNLYDIMGIELSYAIIRKYHSLYDIFDKKDIQLLSQSVSLVISDTTGINHDTDADNDAVVLAKKYIAKSYQKEICLDDVARYVDLSSAYFSRLFKQQTGENFIDYLIKIRMEKGKSLLAETNLKTYQIGERGGYNNSKYFCKLFKNYTGYTPTEYRTKIKRMH